MFLGADIYNLSYSNEINKPGALTFSIPIKNGKASTLNLKPFNKVILEKGTTGKFIGYIEDMQVDLNQILVNCVGMLGFFKYRLYSANILATPANTAISNILTTVNASDNTGITLGTATVTNIVNDINFSRSDVLSAWQKIAQMANNSEFIINTDKTLDFLPKLGTDKSGTIVFRYISSQINTATIYDFNIELSGKDMANSIQGYTSGLSSFQQDAPSILVFGQLDEAKDFSQTNNGLDLASEVLSYLDNHKSEFYVPKIVPNIQKIDIESFDLGDIVKIKLDNGFISIDENQRIIKKTIKISNNLKENCELNLSSVTKNLLPSPFLGDILEMEKRIKLLEGNI